MKTEKKLFTTRESTRGVEVLVEYDSEGHETWEPLVNVLVRDQPMQLPNGAYWHGSLAEALELAGWISPDADLSLIVCDIQSRKFPDSRCLRRQGHLGPHQRPGLLWSDEFS